MIYITYRFLLLTAFLVANLFLAHFIVSFFITHIQDHPISKYVWQLGIYLLFYFFVKLLHSRFALTREPILIAKANVMAIITVFSIIFLLKEAENYSRFYVLVFFTLNTLLVFVPALLHRYFMHFSFLKVKVLALCDDAGLDNVQKWTKEFSLYGFEVSKIINISKLDLQEVKNEIRESVDNRYYATIVSLEKEKLSRTFYYMKHIQNYFHRVYVLPNNFDMALANAEVFNTIGHEGLVFSLKNNLLNPAEQFYKLVFDVMVTTLLIILFSPLLVLLFAVVFVSTKGKPIFRHQRIGKDGKPFGVYKFKTMKENADAILQELLVSNDAVRREWEQEFKLKNDPRVTKVGNFLRKTSLDELPQLLNVLKGEMSLVGPRPIVEGEIEKYGEYYRFFTAVKPGMTGLWQVSGRNDVGYKERVELDVWYVKNWSVELDLSILQKTVSVVLARNGSY